MEDFCKECGMYKEVDMLGHWCEDCLEDLNLWVEEKEREGKSAYGLKGWY